jgi:OOP family OmpA-OmpF porin
LGAAFLAPTLSAAPGHAQQVELGASVEATPQGVTGGSTVTADDGDDSLAPRGNLWELGIFGGLLFISERNAFHEPALPLPSFRVPSPEVGLRLAYLPLSFLGAEGEFMAAASELDTGEGAITWAGRGHLLLQVPTRVVSPFVLIGGGRMGIFSDASGDDSDPALHFGGGLKINLHHRVALRLDVRDTITKQRPASDTAHHIEALAGLSLVFGRPAPRPADTDRDGVVDLQDECPLEPGLLPDGCPVRDRDGDGIPDPQDQCPTEAGLAPTGCPVRDADGDGVLDRDDKCVDVAGVAPHGCPADSDGDGFVDSQDKCPNEPENKNGFEDNDGCPDEIPEQVKKFTGVIKGIEFELNKAEIRPMSRPLLDEAAAVLNQHPTLKVMITGHTDSRGAHQHNIDLSRRRAEAVKTYLMDRGVDAERVLTRGEGPDSPISDNTTAAGRQMNRRIEFQIIK